MSDIERALRDLAERGHPRGAREVFAAAAAPARRTHRGALAVAGLVAAGLVVGAVLVDRSSTSQEVVAAGVSLVEPGQPRPFPPIVAAGESIIGASTETASGRARVLRSEDGGRSFVAVELPDAPDAIGPMSIQVEGGRVVVRFSTERRAIPGTTPSSLPAPPTHDVYEWTTDDGTTWTGGLESAGERDPVTPIKTTCAPSDPVGLPGGTIVSDCHRLYYADGGDVHEAAPTESIVQPFTLGDAVIAPVIDRSGRVVRLVILTS